MIASIRIAAVFGQPARTSSKFMSVPQDLFFTG
jgi:hypothetical protein